MLILLNIQHLLHVTNATTPYDIANICGCVERVLTKCYLMDCETTRYNPFQIPLSSNAETLIHHEVKKVLPTLMELRNRNSKLYVDIGINGTLILTTVQPKNDHHLFYTSTLSRV